MHRSQGATRLEVLVAGHQYTRSRDEYVGSEGMASGWADALARLMVGDYGDEALAVIRGARSQLHAEAKDWSHFLIPPDREPHQLAARPVKADREYLSATLRSLRIVHSRSGFDRLYGVVHSFISIGDQAGRVGEFNFVTTPSSLQDIDSKNLDRVITGNFALLDAVPYRGDKPELQIALFSVKADDLAAPYLALVGSLSKQAGVSYIAAVQPFLEPLKLGVNLLAGRGSDTVLEVGLFTTLDPLETGTHVVARADKSAVNPDDYSLDATYTLVDGRGDPVREWPYIVFSVTADAKRQFWQNIPDVKAAYKLLRETVERGEAPAQREAYRAFRATTLLSPDLLLADAKRVVAEVRKHMSEVAGINLEAVDDVGAFPEKELRQAASQGAQRARESLAAEPRAAGGPASPAPARTLPDLEQISIY